MDGKPQKIYFFGGSRKHSAVSGLPVRQYPGRQNSKTLALITENPDNLEKSVASSVLRAGRWLFPYQVWREGRFPDGA